MNDFAPLLYLEARSIVNTLRQVAKQPARLVMWLLAIAYFGFFGYLRSHDRTFAPTARGLGEPFDTLIFCGATILTGVGIYFAAAGHVAAFTSQADARFLIGSRLRERNVIAWLQIRHTLHFAGRLIAFILLYTVIFHQAGTFVGMALAMLGATLTGAAFGIPVVKMQHRFGDWSGYALAAAVIVCGVLPALFVGLAYIAPSAVPLANATVHLGLGRLVATMLAGDGWSLAGLFGAAAVLNAAAYMGSQDLYPELYRTSERSITISALRRSGSLSVAAALGVRPGRRASAGSVASADSGGALLSGAWALLWKDWIAFAHSKNARSAFAFAVAGAAAVGAIVGAVARRSHDPGSTIAASVGGIGSMLVVFLSFGSTIALAVDLRKPVWWFSSDPLRLRLYVWTLAGGWRIAVPIAVGVLTAAAVVGSLPLLALAVPAIVMFVTFLRAIGLALYALFPSRLDQRGPVAMLRALLIWLALMPPVFLWLVLVVAAHAAVLGGILALALALLELLLLVELAVARIANNGIAFAQAEG